MGPIALAGLTLQIAGLPACLPADGAPAYEVALPLLAGAPSIDGRIGEGEWRSAVSAFGFRTLGAGLIAGEQPLVLLARDREAFYLAARLPLPAGARPKASAQPDGKLWEDDSAELFLDPHPGDKVYYQFIVNAGGTTWESVGQDASFSAEWSAKTQVDRESWSAEIRVPYAALRVAPPADGEVWGVNVGWDRQTPAPAILTWAPVVSGFHEPARFRPVAFVGGARPFTIRQWGADPRAGTLTLSGECSLAAGQAGRAEMTISSVAGGKPTVVASTRADVSSGSPGAFALQAALPVKDAWSVPDDYEARVVLTVAEGGGPEIVCTDIPIPFRIVPQLQVTLRNYLLGERKVIASVSTDALSAPKRETVLRVTLQTPTGDVRAEQRLTAIPETGPAEVTFDVAGLAPGEYAVRATALDRAGNEVAAAEAPLTRPDTPSWLGSKEGLSDRVLPPWTPVRADGRTVRVWGREYEFDGLPLPTRVVTRGAAILSGPVRFVATVNGAQQRWTAPKTDLLERKPNAAVLETSVGSDKLRLTSTIRVEYDGVVRSDLSFQPLEPTKLDSLVLELPIKAAHAKYLYHFPGRWGSAYNAGALPPDGFKSGFRPFIWLGDDDRGLAWFSESDRGFTPAGADDVVQITRQGDTVLLSIKIIGQPVDLREPLTYTFGLQATPVKPVTEDVWDFRICHHGDYGIEDRLVSSGATLEYPPGGNLNPARGTLEAWVRPQFNPDPAVAPDDPGRGVFNRDFFMLDFGALRHLGFYWNIDDRGMRVFIKEGDQYPILIGTTSHWQKGEWHHVALTWGDRMCIYVDGQLLGSRPYIGTLPDRIETGTLRFGGDPCEFDVDEVRISDLDRSSFDLTQPLQVDEHTLLLDHLDGTFQPDGAKPTNPVKGVPGRPSTGSSFVDGKFGKALALYQAGKPKTLLDRLAELGVRTICFHEHWTDIQNHTSTTHGEALHKLVQACHGRGIKLLLYFGYEMSNIAPEWPLYSDECLVEPRAGGYHRLPEQMAYVCCYESAWQDFLADGIAKMIDQYDIDGVYLDGTEYPWACANRHHGCGHVRPDGTVVQTYPFFAYREMLRRIYTIVRSRKPDGLVNVHNSTCMVTPSLGYATSSWDGEQFGGLEPGPWALEVLPLDTFRCEFMGRQWGVPAEMLCYNRPYTYRQAMSFTLLHDILVRGSLGGSLELESMLWKAMDEFGRKQAKFMPYWEEAGFAKVSDPAIKVSAYSRGAKGAMLVISNLGKDPVDAKVELERARLGLPAGRKLTATDVVSRADVPVDGDALSFRLDSLDFRAIRLTPQG